MLAIIISMKAPVFIDEKKYISTREAAQRFDYTSDYVGQLAREGKIASTKVGRSRFVSEADLETYKTNSASKQKAQTRVVPTAPRKIQVSSVEHVIEFVPVTDDEEFELLPQLDKSKRPVLENHILDEKLFSLDEILTTDFTKDTPDASSPQKEEPVVVFSDAVPVSRLAPLNTRGSSVLSSYRKLVLPAVTLGTIMFMFSPILFSAKPLKTVASDVYTKISQEGVFEFMSDSVSGSASSLFSFKNDRPNSSLKDLAVGVYTSMSEGGVGELIGDAVVYSLGAAVGEANTSTAQGSFDRLAAGVFTRLSGAFKSAGNALANLFKFETEFTTVVVNDASQPLNENTAPSNEDFKERPSNPSGSKEGLVVLPPGDEESNDERIARVKKSFSDEVRVIPDESGTSGVIQPIFREVRGDDYLYVLVPLEEENEN